MCNGACACDAKGVMYSVTVTVQVTDEDFRLDRESYLEQVGPKCATVGRDMFLQLMAEYDRRKDAEPS